VKLQYKITNTLPFVSNFGGILILLEIDLFPSSSQDDISVFDISSSAFLVALL